MNEINIKAFCDAYKASFTKNIITTIISIISFCVGEMAFYIPWVEQYHPICLSFASIILTVGVLGCYSIFIAPIIKYIILPSLSKLFDIIGDEIKT